MVTALKNITIWLATAGIILTISAQTVLAATLNLSPSTGQGNQFSVQILLDTQGDPTIETDISLNYDTSKLQFSDIIFGNLYPDNIYNHNPNSGTISTYSYFGASQPAQNFTGSGILATIEFIGTQLGQTNITINCIDGETNDSNVISQTQDRLNCQQSLGGSYTVTSIGAVSQTPTPSVTSVLSPTQAPTLNLTATSTRAPTPTAVPTSNIAIGSSQQATPTPIQELLESGSITPTLTLSFLSAMLLISGLFLFI